MEQERERLAELARKSGRGDEAAFSDLFQATHQRIYYLARQLLGDDGEAMDAAQEAFLKAWKALPQLEHPEAVVTWLFRITDNLCKDRLRKNADLLLEDAGDAPPEQEETDEQLLPQELMDRAETRRLVRDMIDALPGPQKECILLYYFAGLSVGEIAAQQECSEGTVKSRLNYGRQQIKSAVLALEKEEGTKLYTLAPLPLLLGFLQEVPADALPDPTAFQAVWATLAQEAGLSSAYGGGAGGAVAGSGATGGTAAMTGATGVAASIAGKVAGATLGTKIAAGVLAVVLVGGGAAGVVTLTQKDAPPPLELVIRPVPGEVMAGRGFSQSSPTAYPTHTGIDLVAVNGEQVVATQSGYVDAVHYPTEGSAAWVSIEHENSMRTTYKSLSSIEFVAGTYVQAGDVIGVAGTFEEEESIAPHVHFELSIDGKFVDPASYLPN